LHVVSQRKVLKTLNVSWSCEVAQACGRHAWGRWRFALLSMRFVSLLTRRLRLNNCADAIKGLINASALHYQIRSSVKNYLDKVKNLQWGMRASVKLRSHIRNALLMPMLWDIETSVLGELVGIPRAVIEHEVQLHRAIWDPKGCLAEAARLGSKRHHWSTHIGGRPSAAPVVARSTTSKPTRADCRKVLLTVANADSTTPGTNAHPFMALIAQYRLTKELRDGIVSEILRENLDRWYQKYVEYKEDCITFKSLWSRWRKTVADLGPANQSMWPTPPMFPTYPTEVAKVNHQSMRAKVQHAVRETEAGHLL